MVIPGGFSPDILRREPRIVNFVRDAFLADKPVGAICHAPWLAICAGHQRPACDELDEPEGRLGQCGRAL